ncbi:hypothetical protein ACLOJK_006126 [Asimina triloba]
MVSKGGDLKPPGGGSSFITSKGVSELAKFYAKIKEEVIKEHVHARAASWLKPQTVSKATKTRSEAKGMEASRLKMRSKLVDKAKVVEHKTTLACGQAAWEKRGRFFIPKWSYNVKAWVLKILKDLLSMELGIIRENATLGMKPEVDNEREFRDLEEEVNQQIASPGSHSVILFALAMPSQCRTVLKCIMPSYLETPYLNH